MAIFFFFCPGSNQAEYNIHGLHVLPKAYHLEFLPHNAHVTSDPEVDSAEVKLCKSQNRLKAFVAIGQVIVGIITLLRARGDQIQQFGRAATFLTVTPYITTRLFSNLSCSITRDG